MEWLALRLLLGCSSPRPYCAPADPRPIGAVNAAAMLFAGWSIEKDEVVDGIADWGLKKSKVARFAARKP